jgi:outer membrane protein assembly factor BamB
MPHREDETVLKSSNMQNVPDRANATTNKAPEQKRLRLWPGVVIVALQWLARFIVPIVVPEAVFWGVLGGLLGGLAVMVWWAFFSRAPRFERWSAVILIVVVLIVTQLVVHESMRLAPFVAFTIPVLSLGFVLWALSSRHLSSRPRRATMVMTIVFSCAVWILIQTGGITSDFHSDFAWRWAQTPEQRLLAQAGDEPMVLTGPAATDTGAQPDAHWPGFRGSDRNSIIPNVHIETDWSTSPPVELWRRPVGPGWSSFAVSGDLFYTQEQRGDDEIVACYKLTTGAPVWQHRDAARFWESNGGAGPRGTPTLSAGRIYTLGGTGIVNVLNARDGTVVWSRNAASDTQTKVPTWGFSGSPWVVDDIILVAATGSLIAYDLDTGKPRWFNTTGGNCYSSPHLLHSDGVTQVLLQNEAGVSCVTAADGTPLWEHPWPGTPIVQPALCANGDILISASDRSGMRRLAVTQNPNGWTVQTRWTSRALKPNFNDSVVHNGHVYGFNSRSLTCIDVENGQRKWKGGRYGGQLLLLADQDLLLVLSEKGELVLVEAIPGQFTERARFGAIKGKTWNHPVLVGDILLVRNAQEMAAFRLPLADPI